jgi:hypothetical protein
MAIDVATAQTKTDLAKIPETVINAAPSIGICAKVSRNAKAIKGAGATCAHPRLKNSWFILLFLGKFGRLGHNEYNKER